MKLIILLLVLTVSTLSYANSINFLKLIKRSVTFDEEAFINNLSEECINELDNSEYNNECMPEFTISNYKQVCQQIKSEKCQKFYNDPDKSKYYPICSKIPQYNEIFNPLVFKSAVQGLQLKCQFDENGELCPFSLYSITKTGADEVLDDTCKSNKCTEELLEVYKDTNIDQLAALESSSFSTGNFSYEELSVNKYIITALKSEKCQSQHATSNASHTKTNTSLLISLLLLLLL